MGVSLILEAEKMDTQHIPRTLPIFWPLIKKKTFCNVNNSPIKSETRSAVRIYLKIYNHPLHQEDANNVINLFS